ncbi:hypothetical protein [Serratia odorifera]|nr:hypothetical protein [Serratia odorifera]PNK92776.1 hypothetical protein CEQ31_000710 [Serratia odorifera]RII73997.1 hypothetical protein DX901_00775 [Serratia odorifera]
MSGSSFHDERKSIDTILLSVTVDKLSQREWGRVKLMNPMDPLPPMVAIAILEHRTDTVALSRLQDAGD